MTRGARRTVRTRCRLCEAYARHLILRRIAGRPVSYELRCSRCDWVWRGRAPLNYWVWLKRRYGLSPHELRRVQKLAFMRIFGPDESFRFVSFERMRGGGTRTTTRDPPRAPRAAARHAAVAPPASEVVVIQPAIFMMRMQYDW